MGRFDPPVLATDDIILRPPAETDVSAIVRACRLNRFIKLGARKIQHFMEWSQAGKCFQVFGNFRLFLR